MATRVLSVQGREKWGSEDESRWLHLEERLVGRRLGMEGSLKGLDWETGEAQMKWRVADMGNEMQKVAVIIIVSWGN